MTSPGNQHCANCIGTLSFPAAQNMSVRNSAHRGKWSQLTPPEKMDEKLKRENMQKEQLSMFKLYFESNQSRQV